MAVRLHSSARRRWSRFRAVLRLQTRRFLSGGERGATTLEWVLLLAAVALPSYFIVQTGLKVLLAHYQMVTTMNGLPFP